MALSKGTAPSVLLRRGEPRDLSVLVAYNIAMAKETENIDLEHDIITAGVQKVLEGKTSASYYILEEDGMVVAQLMITFEWSDWRAADIWWIQSVYVAPAARKRGYFRKLYEYVRQEAEVCKAVGLRLYADSKNLPAQATYQKLGMRTHYLVFEDMFTSY
ncbi:acyl-CoA N-acyltransferase [Haematococcus lacustris]